MRNTYTYQQSANHSLTHSITHPATQPPSHPATQPPTHPLTHSLINEMASPATTLRHWILSSFEAMMSSIDSHVQSLILSQYFFLNLPNLLFCSLLLLQTKLGDAAVSKDVFIPSVLCRMKMLPVMISAKYHSSARSAVSESPNSSA